MDKFSHYPDHQPLAISDLTPLVRQYTCLVSLDIASFYYESFNQLVGALTPLNQLVHLRFSPKV